MKSSLIFAALLFGVVLFQSSPVEARNHCRSSTNFNLSFCQSTPAPVYYYTQPQPVYYVQAPAPAPVYAYPAPVYGGPVYVVERPRPVCQPRLHFGFFFGR